MFIEQAYKGNNAWWRVALTTFFTTIVFVANVILFFLMSEEKQQKTYDLMKTMGNHIALFVALIPFPFLLCILFLFVFLLHRRSILSLTTARPKFDFGRMFFSFSFIVLFTVAGFAISYQMDSSNIVWNFDPVNFTILLIISLILFPLQIGFEEYLFRGYLMQQIGVAVHNRWFPLLMTSVFFGLFHSANPEVSEMGFGIMFFYIGTGLLLGIMTLMDDSLELALGFHLGNNLMAALLITSDFSALQTDALFRYTAEENPAAMLSEMLVTMAVTYPLFLLILAKKYKWHNWKEKLTGKVHELKKITNASNDTNL